MGDLLDLIDLGQQLVTGLPAKGLKITHRAAIGGDHTQDLARHDRSQRFFCPQDR
jgi:hypothetical protein